MIENVSFKAEGGVRLDAALLVRFPSTTRALVREACAAGGVLVGGRPAGKGCKPARGAIVEVRALAEAADNHVLADPSVRTDAIFEDASLLAFDKPAGMPVHPLSRNETGTLMNGVAARWPETAAAGDDPFAAGAVHRIDTGTSGLVLVARTPDAFAAMRAQFAARSVKKTYLALVEGAVAAGGTLENDLAHNTSLPYCRMDVLPPMQDGGDASRAGAGGRRRMRAVTSFKPLALTRCGMEERTLLEVAIHTGVTHQIRAQLAAAGMHIVNDRLYGAFAVEDMEGHCLHALSAAFKHPVSGDDCVVSTPWPAWALEAAGRG